MEIMKVWTFVIKGGKPIEITLPGTRGPGLRYEGRTTIWKMVGTEEQAVAMESLLKGPLVEARVERFTETAETETQEIYENGGLF